MKRYIYYFLYFKISSKFILLSKRCEKCHNKVKLKTMWNVINNINSWKGLQNVCDNIICHYFCSKCFSIDDIGRNELEDYLKINGVGYTKRAL